jgi:hypothetical protein
MIKENMKSLITILITLTTLIGCTDEYDLLIPSSDKIWPLAEGNKWIFDVSATIMDTNSVQFPVLISVDSSFLWDDESLWYRLTTISNLLPLNQTYRLESDGLHRLIFSSDGNSAINELYLKFPCDVSEIWTLSDGNIVRLLSNSDQIRSPVGDYSGCYRYREYITVSSYNEITLFPGIGPLLMNYMIYIPYGGINLPVTGRAELVSYEVN